MQPPSEHQDFVGVDDGRQAMGDDQGGVVARHQGQGLQDGLLRARVEGGGGLVEHQDARPLQHGAGDGHALLLAAGQLQAALAHQGVVAMRQRLDEVVDLRQACRREDVLAAGVGPAVGDVVVQRVVEQHGVLRHDADGLAQAVLGHVAHVLAVDQYAAAADVVETEQQTRQGGFAAAAGADHGHLAPGGDREVHIEQDGALGVVGEADVLEADGAVAHRQLRCAGAVGDLGWTVQQVEHLRHVRQRMLELGVDHAEEVERDEHLQHEGVDQHQVAQRHAAVDDAACRQAHDQGDAHGDDGALADVQAGQRGLRLHRHVFPAGERGVVAAVFVALVVEVFHRLEIEQAVHRLGVGLRVQRIHLMTVLHAPVGDGEGKGDIDRHGDEGDDGKPRVVLHQQHRGDQRHLDQRRQDVEQHVVEQRGRGAGTALQVAGDGAGLALQVKAQTEGVQVLEKGDRQPAHDAVAHAGEHHVAQFVEGRTAQAQHAVGEQQDHGQGQLAQTRGVEIVDDLLQRQRHADIGEFGQDQEQHRQRRTATVGPEVGQQEADGLPVAARLGGGFGMAVVHRHRSQFFDIIRQSEE